MGSLFIDTHCTCITIIDYTSNYRVTQMFGNKQKCLYFSYHISFGLISDTGTITRVSVLHNIFAFRNNSLCVSCSGANVTSTQRQKCHWFLEEYVSV